MITDTVVKLSQTAIKRPSLYKVIILDDNISTMQCVIDTLTNYFNKNEDEAYELMMQVHITGSCVAGIYPKDLAETKIALAKADLNINGYPLTIKLLR